MSAEEEKPQEPLLYISAPNEPVEGGMAGREFPETLEELELPINRLEKIENLTTPVNLTRLVLRQNQIKVIEGLDALVKLEYLDLYFNEIEVIQGLDKLTSLTYVARNCAPATQPRSCTPRALEHAQTHTIAACTLSPSRYLDLSFNSIRKIENLDALVNVTELYLIQNKIKVIQGLDGLAAKLRLLELGANRIRVMENLDALVNLEQLFLGKNKIEKIEGLDKLAKLRQLSLQSNRIEEIGEAVATLDKLEELYLADNGVETLPLALGKLPLLHTIDLSGNRIAELPAELRLEKVTEFWMSNNAIDKWPEVERIHAICPKAETVYLNGNPVSNDPRYLARVRDLIPGLTQIDATYM